MQKSVFFYRSVRSVLSSIVLPLVVSIELLSPLKKQSSHFPIYQQQLAMAEEEILFEISREDPDQTEFVIAATMDNLITEGKKKVFPGNCVQLAFHCDNFS
jgi:hypothetical protein